MRNEIRELSADELESVSGGALDGINYLIAVTQMKADNANNNAMAGAQARLSGCCATGEHIKHATIVCR